MSEPSDPTVCMYVLTIRDGLQTRHVGPYTTPQQAAQDVDRVVEIHGDRVHWQIHELVPPAELLLDPQTPTRPRAAAA
ncbi:MAG: hypothetical protein ACK5Q7_14125 [Cyanobacteriota bacterium]|nr:hypothetical protein [Cyanobacteriota bacterium]